MTSPKTAATRSPGAVSLPSTDLFGKRADEFGNLPLSAQAQSSQGKS